MCSFLSCQQCHEFLLYVLITTIKVVNYFSAYGLSLASRVESHDSVVWLRTGVSSGNQPTNVLKSRKYRAHRLKARMLGVSGTPVSDAVGSLGILEIVRAISYKLYFVWTGMPPVCLLIR